MTSYSTVRLINRTDEYGPADTHLHRARRPHAAADPRAARQSEATVNEIARPFPISLQAVSKHLKVLERAGLIARGKDRQLRPSRIQGAAFKEAAAFLEDYREFWDETFDRLGEHLDG